MCGIAGVVLGPTDAPIELDAVERMARRLAHRGPDGAGAARIGPAVFGHRRLAVIDLSAAAAQPMQTSDGAQLLSYNGEVYNHRDLRAELERAGARFRSNSDTEVVLEGYRHWGDAVVERLNGMFAFALWDQPRQRLLLARDPYGQKPLYLTRTAGGGVAFASEVSALRALPGALLAAPWELDPAALAHYFTFDSFPGRLSVWRGVQKLPPGHAAAWSAGELRTWQTWRRRYTDERPPPREAAARVWRLLVSAVERCLQSDVPLGVFLSGGLDSSAVVAAAAECVDAGSLRTFSIGFEDPSYDESWAAEEVARAFGTRHRTQILGSTGLLEHLDGALASLDEPLADASIVPTYALARAARRDVTVALGGDGGDELFAGYDTFVAERLVGLVQAAPAWARRWALAAAERAPPSGDRTRLASRARRFLRGLDPDPIRRGVRWFGSFLPEEAAALVRGSPPAEALFAEVERAPFPAGPQASLDLWARWYLPDDVLTKVDRASMAVSLEVRAPFLDVDLAAYAHALALDYKVRGLTRKWILKQALRGRVPERAIRRPKQGFAPPVAAWLRGPLRAEVERLLAPAAVARWGLLDPARVDQVVRDHMAGADRPKSLWALFVLARWLERHAPGA